MADTEDFPVHQPDAPHDAGGDAANYGHDQTADVLPEGAGAWDGGETEPADDFQDPQSYDDDPTQKAEVKKGRTGLTLLLFLGLLVVGAGSFAYMQFGMQDAGGRDLPPSPASVAATMKQPAAQMPPVRFPAASDDREAGAGQDSETAQAAPKMPPPMPQALSLPTAEPPPSPERPAGAGSGNQPPSALPDNSVHAQATVGQDILPPVVDAGAEKPIQPGKADAAPLSDTPGLPPQKPVADLMPAYPEILPQAPGIEPMKTADSSVGVDEKAQPPQAAGVPVPGNAAAEKGDKTPAGDNAATAAEAAMQEEAAALKKQIADLQQTIGALNEEIAAMRQKEESSSAANAAVRDEASEKPAPVRAVKKAAEKKQSRPSAAKPKTARSAAVKKWVLRAATPGSAWIAESATSEKLRHIKVGDVVPGLGRIQSIASKNGRWVVKGTAQTLR